MARAQTQEGSGVIANPGPELTQAADAMIRDVLLVQHGDCADHCRCGFGYADD